MFRWTNEPTTRATLRLTGYWLRRPKDRPMVLLSPVCDTRERICAVAPGSNERPATRRSCPAHHIDRIILGVCRRIFSHLSSIFPILFHFFFFIHIYLTFWFFFCFHFWMPCFFRLAFSLSPSLYIDIMSIVPFPLKIFQSSTFPSYSSLSI